MFRNKNLATANQIIDSLLDSKQLEKREGAIVLHRKAGRKTVATGTIYLRDSFIYAVNIDVMPTPIARRVATAGFVDREELENVLRTVGSNENSPQIVDLLLERQLISNKVIDGYVKEHFIAQISEILTWENVLGEWHPNVATKAFVMPYVSFTKIREVISKRIALRNEFNNLTARFFRSEEVPLLTFTLTQKNIGDKNNETIAVSKFCNNQSTIGQISQATGLTENNVFQIILVLWKEELLTIHLGGIQVPYSSAQAAQNLSLGKNVEEVLVPSQPPIYIPGTEPEPEPEPVEEEEPAVVFEEVPDTESEEHIIGHFPAQEYKEINDNDFNENLHDILAPDFPEPVIDPIITQIADDKEDNKETPATVEEITELHHAPEFTIPNAPLGGEIAPLAIAAPVDDVIPEETKEQPQEADSEALASVDSSDVEPAADETASSDDDVETDDEEDDDFIRLTRELETLQEKFAEAVDALDDAETARDEIISKKEELENQLIALNKALEQADKEYDEAQKTYTVAYDRVQTAVNNFTFPTAGE